MEIDFRGKLHVRPFGFLAFIVPILAIAMSTYYYYKISELKSEYPFAFSSWSLFDYAVVIKQTSSSKGNIVLHAQQKYNNNKLFQLHAQQQQQ